MFPGTIWVVNHGSDNVVIYEPVDFSDSCTGADSDDLDEDGDGYTNADEIDNGTNPCSPGDLPSDVDDDGVSDLNDNDDDNDGIPDVDDLFPTRVTTADDLDGDGAANDDEPAIVCEDLAIG